MILDITFLKITLVCMCACLCTCMSVCMCMLIYLCDVCACVCHSTCVEVGRQLAEVISPTIRVPGNELGSQARQQAHLEAPSLFSDSFASSAFPGGTQGLMSLYCMPLMPHLYHVCPHTSFMHESPAWRDGLKVLSSLLVLSTMG